ncbi:MAG: hypothetical protein COT73_13035 [Bdellovibrio sp. CG10_big_fil_rev_8_21_14_0_10_47_8]|nr:MAG: hypothetical protein COT73_13035 [Bdellovibrio sp. CG10_big_fil_rev_8_21_14_0_10_47_8]
MKFLVGFLMLIAWNQANAATLLNCNVSDGADQQVMVIETNGNLTLRELTMGGRWIERALTAKEWSSKKILLHSAPGEKTIFAKVGSEWTFHVTGPGYDSYGYADCF